MNHLPLRGTNVRIMHPDPFLSAGLVAALRVYAGVEVFVHGAGSASADEPQVDVVVADYGTALQPADGEVRRSYGLPGSAKVLALTPNDREVDIRRAIEAGVYGYLLAGRP
ncbi:MAG: uncharacterized protein JWQ76_2438 [Ramlibacter sp.]|nr:uncharacterized protein [Ramlibacter sp.]